MTQQLQSGGTGTPKRRGRPKGSRNKAPRGSAKVDPSTEFMEQHVAKNEDRQENRVKIKERREIDTLQEQLLPPEIKQMVQLGREQQDVALKMSDQELLTVEGFQHLMRGTPAWCFQPEISERYHFGIFPRASLGIMTGMRVTLPGGKSVPLWGLVHRSNEPWPGLIEDGLVPESGFDSQEGVWHCDGNRDAILLWSPMALRRAYDLCVHEQQQDKMRRITHKYLENESVQGSAVESGHAPDIARHHSPKTGLGPSGQFIENKGDLDRAIETLDHQDSETSVHQERMEESLAAD